MKNTDISQLFGVPFGAQADSTTIAPIPATKTAIGRASMALGFPKENFKPLDNGGQAVSGADLNGILNTLARSAQAAELGVLHPFSAAYAEAIGGYPSGATVAHPTIPGRFLICAEDGNENDPAVNMAGWVDPMASSLASYATTNALNTETQRAEQAEAGLLPLSGGQLTGNLLGSLGAAVPQVLGQTGRIVIQQFVAQTPRGPSSGTIAFPTAYAPGTTPFVITANLTEPADWNGGGQFGSVSCVLQNDDGSRQITNTGFNFVRFNLLGGQSINSLAVPVLAIGVM